MSFFRLARTVLADFLSELLEQGHLVGMDIADLELGCEIVSRIAEQLASGFIDFEDTVLLRVDQECGIRYLAKQEVVLIPVVIRLGFGRSQSGLEFGVHRFFPQPSWQTSQSTFLISTSDMSSSGLPDGTGNSVEQGVVTRWLLYFPPIAMTASPVVSTSVCYESEGSPKLRRNHRLRATAVASFTTATAKPLSSSSFKWGLDA